MVCSKCGKSNPGASKFCRGCGAGLDIADQATVAADTWACADCGQSNRPAARFCASCGQAHVTVPGASADSAVLALASTMVSCPTCGAACAVGARFCKACGNPLAVAPVAQQKPLAVTPQLTSAVRSPPLRSLVKPALIPAQVEQPVSVPVSAPAPAAHSSAAAPTPTPTPQALSVAPSRAQPPQEPVRDEVAPPISVSPSQRSQHLSASSPMGAANRREAAPLAGQGGGVTSLPSPRSGSSDRRLAPVKSGRARVIGIGIAALVVVVGVGAAVAWKFMRPAPTTATVSTVDAPQMPARAAPAAIAVPMAPVAPQPVAVTPAISLPDKHPEAAPQPAPATPTNNEQPAVAKVVTPTNVAPRMLRAAAPAPDVALSLVRAGERNFAQQQYSAAIANAKAALEVKPGYGKAKQLLYKAQRAQQNAVIGIKMR